MLAALQPNARILPVAAPGGAAADLASKLMPKNEDVQSIDFARLFSAFLRIVPNAPRTLGAEKGK